MDSRTNFMKMAVPTLGIKGFHLPIPEEMVIEIVLNGVPKADFATIHDAFSKQNPILLFVIDLKASIEAKLQHIEYKGQDENNGVNGLIHITGIKRLIYDIDLTHNSMLNIIKNNTN